ncbi:MAG: c-type cytochrome [Bacteroidales bacterium]
MKTIKLILLATMAIFLFTACGGGDKPATGQSETKTEEITETKSPLEAQLALGERIYKEKCIVCHQADAKGIPGAFPPLANADYLLADPVRGVAQTLNGSNEEMIVNGVVYNAPMTPQVETREEALAVINYVLKHFNGYTKDQLLDMEDIKDVVIDPIKL